MSRSSFREFLGSWARDLGRPRVTPDAEPTTALRAQAKRHLEAHDHAAARASADALLTLDPDDAFALYVRAMAGQKLDDHVASREDARRLVGLPAERLRQGGVDGGLWLARAWYVVAYASQVLQDEPAADAAFAKIEATAGAEPSIRGWARASRWDLEGALADLRPAPASLLRKAGRLDEAVAANAAALASGPDPAEQVRLRSERWELLTIVGDDAGAEAELAALPDRDERWGLVGVAAALAGDRPAARAALERATAGTLDAEDAWQWAVSLGLRPPGEPPPTRDAWQAAIAARLLGGLDDDDLLALARAAAGARLRTWRLHEAHVGLSLLACGRGDAALELHHLRAAATFGDLGGLLTPWIHGRARRLGSPLEHRPPTTARA